MPEQPYRDQAGSGADDRNAGPVRAGPGPWGLMILGLALLYAGLAMLSLWLGGDSEFAPIRLADGMALAVLWRYGWRLWPGVWLGAFGFFVHRLDAFLPGVSPRGRWVGAMIVAVSATAAAVIGARLLSRTLGNGWLDRSPTDAFRFAVLGGLVSTVIFPSVIVPMAWFDGLLTHSALASWLTVWVGGILSVLLVTPLLVVRRTATAAGPAERVLLLLSLILVGQLVFGSFGGDGTRYPIVYVMVIWPMWAAIRTDLRGTAQVLVVLAVLTVLGTTRGHGPYAGGAFAESLLVSQGFLVFVAFPFLVMAGVISAYRTAVATRRDSETRLGAILDHSPSPIFVKDLAGRYVLINRRFEAVMGVSRAAVLGRLDDEIFPVETARQLRAHDRQVLSSGKPLDVEELVPLVEGWRTYLLTKFPLVGPTGEPYALCGIATDITERKLSEARQQQIAALQQADALKNDFLAVLSHELRTPLTVVIGFGSLLAQELAGPLSVSQRLYVDKLLASAKNLLRLVNDVLDMGRILAGRFTVIPQPASLTDVVTETVADLQLLASNKQVRLINEVPDTLPPVRIDAQRIRQVLTNLIENAVKFTPAGGRIRVRARRTDDGVTCEVVDSGDGIPSDKQPLLFHPFTQLDMSVRRQAGGAGLGLSISREIVTAHGGRIGVRSQPGDGSTFWFTVPVAVASDRPALPEVA